MARVSCVRHAGFTLIETVLAVSIIGAVTAIAAMVWSSATSHVESAAGTNAESHTQRVIELARSQWASRRVLRSVQASGGQDDGLVTFAHDGVSFVTTRGIVFRDWPLVQVVYRVLDHGDGFTSLIYLETRILSLDGQEPLMGGLGADGRARTGGMVLIERSPDLRIERFGAGALYLTDSDWRRRSGIEFAIDNVSDGQTGGGDDNPRIRLANDEVVPLRIAIQRGLYGDPNVPELLTPKWRVFGDADPIDKRPPAVRIIGEWEGGTIACVFAARDSR